MSDTRMVAMNADQYAEIEHYIEALMRGHQNERAALMMNLSLAYRFATNVAPPMPDNVVQFGDWSRKVGA